MSAGDLWAMPGGHRAIETEGSTRDTLRLMVTVEGWPFPKPPVTCPRSLCERLPSRYLHGQTPRDQYDL